MLLGKRASQPCDRPFMQNVALKVQQILSCGRSIQLELTPELLGVLVDAFTFLSGSGTDGSTQQASPQTPVPNKLSIRDLWDRTDIDDINTAEGP
jgi:hypothetical protein